MVKRDDRNLLVGLDIGTSKVVAIVAEVSPESAVGGPLSLVQNGDRISIDVDAHALDLEVPESELAARRARLGEPALPKSTGYLSIYQRTVQPMSTGAVLVKKG